MARSTSPFPMSNIPVPPTGGTVTYDGLYTIHQFLTSSALVVSSSVTAQVLVVGGGGNGGIPGNGGGGGGGGGGGIIYNATYAFTPGSKTVTIGGLNQNTTFGSFTANKGSSGENGGSPMNTSGAGGASGGGTYGVFAGGAKSSYPPTYGPPGGGGGGAGGVGGFDRGQNLSPYGGVGKSFDITQSGVFLSYGIGGFGGLNYDYSGENGYGRPGSTSGIVIIRYLT